MMKSPDSNNTESALIAGEKRFRALIERSSDGIVLLSVEGKVVYESPSATRLIGFDPSERIGKSVFDNIYADDLEVARAKFVDVVKNPGGFVQLEYRAVRKDGSLWWSEVTATNLLEDPNVQGIVINFRDITERKRAEEKLYEQDEIIHLVLENSHIGLNLLDMNTWKYTFMSPSQVRLTGFSVEEMNDFSDEEALARVHPDDLNVSALQKKQISEGKEEQISAEYRWKVKSGEYRWFNDTRKLVRDKQGKPVAMVGVSIDITERKRTEQKIHEKEAQYRLITENASDVIWVMNPFEDRFTYVSPSVEKLRGYTVEEVMAQPAGAALTPKSLVYVKALLTENIPIFIKQESGTMSFVTEVDQPCKDGSIVNTEVTTTFTFNEQHQVEIIGVSRDITSRRQAQLKLSESEEKYRGLIESLDSVVATIDYDGRFLYVNDVAARHFGCTPQALIGKTIHDFFPEPVASQQLQGVRSVILEDKGHVTEDPSVIQGQPRWFHNSLQPIHNETGKVAYVLLHSVDVHELKTTQQELAELNRTLEERIEQATSRIHDLYENAPTGYHSLDAEGKILMINQTELNWLGYTREELIGQPFTRLFNTAGLTLFKTNFPEFMQKGSINNLEFELVRRDGSLLPVLVSATAIKDAEGNFVMSRSVLTDITARKQAEEALKLANTELKRVVKIKDEFLASMSHELRTPLNAILGHAELLTRQLAGPMSERQLRSMHAIEKSGRHLLDLITEILDLSKLEAKQMTLDISPLVVADVCEASLLFIREAAKKKNIILNSRIDPDTDLIQADGRRLKQMLINLLSNAVKFTPDGGSVELRVTPNREDHTVSFAVSDTGIGITPENIERLFQPFVQLDSGLNRRYEGSGLGLTLVERMTKLHGGSITVKSEVGKGSTFTIILPCKEFIPISPASTTGSNELAEIREVANEDNKAPLILIADDNRENLEVVSDFLEMAGFRIVLARNGKEALDQARLWHPALILMDIQMPVMDGLEATRQIRNDADRAVAAIPVIALTALAMSGDRERTLEAGANDYLSKPFSFSDLVRMIKNLL